MPILPATHHASHFVSKPLRDRDSPFAKEDTDQASTRRARTPASTKLKSSRPDEWGSVDTSKVGEQPGRAVVLAVQLYRRSLLADEYRSHYLVPGQEAESGTGHRLDER